MYNGGRKDMVLALVIFLITYALMLMLQKWRPYIALASAAVFVILGCCGVYDTNLISV